MDEQRKQNNVYIIEINESVQGYEDVYPRTRTKGVRKHRTLTYMISTCMKLLKKIRDTILLRRNATGPRSTSPTFEKPRPYPHSRRARQRTRRPEAASRLGQQLDSRGLADSPAK